MSSYLVAVLLVLPFTTAFLCGLVRRRPRVQRVVSLVSATLLVGAASQILWTVLHGSGHVVAQVGGAPKPFGVLLVADVLSATMCLLTAFVVLATVLYGSGSAAYPGRASFHSLVHWLTGGVIGAYLTTDLFNLYVWFELMLIASFVLLAFGGTQGQLEGALKYSVLSLFGSALFLIAVGIAYATTGTLNMGRLATALVEVPWHLRALFGFLLLVAFGIKAAVFPLFFWLPASYHEAPPEVGAVFSGLLTKAGIYAIIRIDTAIVLTVPGFKEVLAWVAAITMVGGVLGAFSQGSIRKILSFHIISQIGYLIMALSLGTQVALAALLFYMVHVVFAKANLFLSGGLVVYRTGTDELDRVDGGRRMTPFLALLFLVPAFSMAGIPPLGGFWGKLFILQEGIGRAAWLLVLAAVVTAFLTLLSMLKVWSEVYWRGAASPSTKVRYPGERTRVLASALLASLILLIGLFPGVLFEIAEAAAAQMADPAGYIAATTEDTP